MTPQIIAINLKGCSKNAQLHRGDRSHFQQDRFVGAVPPAAQMTQLLWPLPFPVCYADPRDIIQMFFFCPLISTGGGLICAAERGFQWHDGDILSAAPNPPYTQHRL